MIVSGEEGGEHLSHLPCLVNSDFSPNLDYQFCLLPGVQDLLVQAVVITVLEGKVLLCVPGPSWHKQTSKRKLPPQALAKPTAVEVSFASQLDREQEAGTVGRVWIGFLNPELVDSLEVQAAGEVPVADIQFQVGDGGGELIPFGGSLFAVTNDHFAFFSAESDPAAGAGSQDLSGRMDRMEATMASLAESLSQLVPQPPKRPSALKATRTSGAAHGQKDRVHFMGLDPSVAAAASSAGVDQVAQEEMSRLLSGSLSGSKKLLEASPKKKTVRQILSEEEDIEEEAEPDEDAGLQDPALPPMERAVSQLADILEALTADKVRKQKTSKLEAALDSATSSATQDGMSLGSGKKAAAARRTLRQALVDSPEEIYGVIERLMLEDLTSRPTAHGVPSQDLCARAWVEHRSKIGAYKVAAHMAWGISGLLDELIRGRPMAARARACLMLLQLDQCAIDKGSWTLAAELSLEMGPPFTALSQHVGPSVQDGESPYSRLLESRWSDILMTHLKDTEDYLNRRRALSKKGTVEEETLKPKIKPKPKQKPASEGDA